MARIERTPIIEQLEREKQALLNQRTQLIQDSVQIMADGTAAEKRAVNASLSAIKHKLRNIAEAEEQEKGDIPGVTKRELIGRLVSWRDRLADRIKNPKTPPGERLFSQQAVDDIQKILFGGS